MADSLFENHTHMHKLAIAYIVCGILEVIAELLQLEVMRWIVKPLLMPIMIVWVYNQAFADWNRQLRDLEIAFVFSWIGDVTLMFAKYNENFFLIGLVAFLITHILYISIFLRYAKNETPSLLRKHFWLVFAIAFYGFGLMKLVMPVLGDMLVPVMVYSTTILAMAVVALYRIGPVEAGPAWIVFIGAGLFVLSDSMIAVNKFLYQGNFPYASVIIMTLYIAAQYFIALGMMKQFEGKTIVGYHND